MKKLMSKVMVHTTLYTMMALITFIVLFDVDGGVAIGTSLWDVSALGSVVAVAEILGNLLWIVGLILLIIGIVLIVMSFIDDMINTSIKDAHDKGILATIGDLSIYGKFVMYVELALGIFAIGSGFWFSGTGIVAFIISLFVWSKIIREARDVKLEELQKKAKEAKEDLLEE